MCCVSQVWRMLCFSDDALVVNAGMKSEKHFVFASA